MFLKQRDIFWGTSTDFMKEVMDNTVKESYPIGEILFRQGDPTDYFYSLIKGRIRLRMRETGQTVYVVSHAGEAFGWSGLTGSEAYSATAECVEPSILLKIHKKDLLKILDRNTADGFIFYKQLSATLGNRLIQCYRVISDATKTTDAPSYGTGQVQEMTSGE